MVGKNTVWHRSRQEGNPIMKAITNRVAINLVSLAALAGGLSACVVMVIAEHP